MNVLKKYWDSVYVYVLILVPSLCSCAGIYWTAAKVLGKYGDVKWSHLIIFDCSQIIYILLAVYGIYMNRKNSRFLIEKMNAIKLIIMVLLTVQYMFIITLFSSEYVWECTFLFMLAIGLFFDIKYLMVNSIIYTFMLVAAHLINTQKFLPIYMDNVEEVLAYRIVIYVLTTFCIGVIVYFVEYFLMRAWESDEENTVLLEKQLKYYKDLELLDLEIRRFKHDVKNHFISMESLLKNERINELKEYFIELKGQFMTKNRILFSGNEVVDAIMHYELVHNCNKNVNISVYGKLPAMATVSSIDLCTVFSNLISNAINGVNKCGADKNAWLEIVFSAGELYFSIEITNNISKDIQEISKNDRNHGHGISKIQNVIKKYNGNYEMKIVEDKIKAIVYLPI